MLGPSVTSLPIDDGAYGSHQYGKVGREAPIGYIICVQLDPLVVFPQTSLTGDFGHGAQSKNKTGEEGGSRNPISRRRTSAGRWTPIAHGTRRSNRPRA